MTYQEIIKAFLHHCQYEYGVELSKYDPTTGDIIDVDVLIESWVDTKRKVRKMEGDWTWLDVTKTAKLFINNPQELKSYHVRVKKEKEEWAISLST